MPHFSHAGAILCGMAGFKRHAAFGFRKHAQVVGEDRLRERGGTLDVGIDAGIAGHVLARIGGRGHSAAIARSRTGDRA